MVEIFRVYASQGRDHYAELELPASDYQMLDLMERLRLEPGKLPYVEVLKIHETYDYLDKCIREQPDIYQLNALARKLGWRLERAPLPSKFPGSSTSPTARTAA